MKNKFFLAIPLFSLFLFFLIPSSPSFADGRFYSSPASIGLTSDSGGPTSLSSSGDKLKVYFSSNTANAGYRLRLPQTGSSIASPVLTDLGCPTDDWWWAIHGDYNQLNLGSLSITSPSSFTSYWALHSFAENWAVYHANFSPNNVNRLNNYIISFDKTNASLQGQTLTIDAISVGCSVDELVFTPPPSLDNVLISGPENISYNGSRSYSAELSCSNGCPDDITYSWSLSSSEHVSIKSGADSDTVTLIAHNTSDSPQEVTLHLSASSGHDSASASKDISISIPQEFSAELFYPSYYFFAFCLAVFTWFLVFKVFLSHFLKVRL